MFLKKLFVFCFTLFTLSVSSQNELSKKDSVNLPISIYGSISDYYLPFYKQSFIEDLKLTGFKFMIVNYSNNGFAFNNSDFANADLRNIGRYISFEDIYDNSMKAQLYQNNVNFNSNHIIWRMWDITLQDQHRKVQQNNN